MENNKKKILYAIVALVLMAGIYKGVKVYIHYQQYESTDDAQMDGNIVPVLARTSSFAGEVLVKDNQIVKEGDLLMRLDSAELLSKYNQALATLNSAKAALDVASANIQVADEAVKSAKLSLEIPKTNLWKAKSEFKRYKELFDLKAATPQQMDNYKANLETAQSNYDLAVQRSASAELQLKTSMAQKNVAEANKIQKEKELDFARLQLSYTHITAPVSGRISKLTLQPGQLVQTGQPMMSIARNDEVWITANFKETQMEHVIPGSTVIIHVDAYPEKEIMGKVTSTGGATGSKFALLPPDNSSGNYVKVVQRVSVRIDIDSTEEIKKELIPGLSVSVEVKR